MALRDIIARFRVQVDRKQLDAANVAVTQTRSSLVLLGTRIRAASQRFLGLGTAAQTAATRMQASAASAAAAGSTLARAGSMLQGVFAGVIATIGFNIFGNFIDDALTAADAIGKKSKALGVASDQLQVFQAFAVTSGTTMEVMNKALAKLARNLNDLVEGRGAQTADAFKALGLEAQQADGKIKTLDVAFIELAEGLRNLDDPTKRAAIAQELLGRSAVDLLPAFTSTTSTIEEQMAALRDLAVVYDEDFIAMTETANDNMYLMGLQFQKIRAHLLSAIIPVFRDVAAKMTPMVARFADAGKESGAFGRAVIAAPLAGVIGLLSVLAAKLGSVSKVLRIAARFVLRFVIPFLIIDDILTFLQGGDSIIGRLLNTMFGADKAAEIAEDLKKAWTASLKWLTETGLPMLGDFLKSTGAGFELLWASFGDNQEELDRATSKFMKATEWMGEIMDPIEDDFEEFFRLISADFTNWAADIGDVLLGMWRGPRDAVVSFAADFGDILLGMWRGPRDAVVSFAADFGDILIGAWEGAVAAAENAADAFAAPFVWIGEAWTRLWSSATATFNGWVTGAREILAGWVGWGGTQIAGILKAWDQVWSSATVTLNGWAEGAREILAGWVGWGVTQLVSLLQIWNQVWSSAKATFDGWAEGAREVLAGWIGWGVTQIASLLQIWNQVWSSAKATFDGWVVELEAKIQALVDWIASVFTGAFDAVGAQVDALVDKAAGLLGLGGEEGEAPRTPTGAAQAAARVSQAVAEPVARAREAISSVQVSAPPVNLSVPPAISPPASRSTTLNYNDQSTFNSSVQAPNAPAVVSAVRGEAGKHRQARRKAAGALLTQLGGTAR